MAVPPPVSYAVRLRVPVVRAASSLTQRLANPAGGRTCPAGRGGALQAGRRIRQVSAVERAAPTRSVAPAWPRGARSPQAGDGRGPIDLSRAQQRRLRTASRVGWLIWRRLQGAALRQLRTGEEATKSSCLMRLVPTTAGWRWPGKAAPHVTHLCISFMQRPDLEVYESSVLKKEKIEPASNLCT
ncbi:hypothetical protein EJB05_20077, partial [Eragrostis curvula]